MKKNGRLFPDIHSREGYRLLYTCALVCIVLTGAGGFLGIARVEVVHILAAFFVIVLCIGIQFLKTKGRLICAVLTAVFLAAVMAAAGVQRCGMFLASWIRWMAGGEEWAAQWTIFYELLQVGIISLVCYLLQFILERFIVIKVISADLLISVLLFCLLTEWELSHTVVVFSVAYIVMIYAEWIQREWKKVGSGDRKKYMLWIMPFVALYFFLMLLMPTPENPYEWRFVRETWSHIRDSFMSLTQNFIQGGGEDFDLTLSGFSEEGELQDKVEENSREVMTLQGTGNLVTNVYLTGRIYDTFDGRMWLQENHDAEEGAFQDAVQIQNALMQMDDSYLRDYIRAETLQVKYRYFRTSYLFTPLKTRYIQMQEENVSYFWDGDNLLFRKRRGYGTEYEVNYYQLNVGASRFDQFLRSVHAGNTDEEQIRRIYEVYMDDIALSEETALYLEDITWSAYDRLGWLRLVEQELSSFTYTKQPEKVPDEVEDAGEFLDYFLLESQEGYCTHFATAFALLARSQGMPSRYVQGYCVPMKKAGEVSVYNDMAHAWPEVYFEGVGWIPFEPTPGYERLRYTPWETGQGEENAAARPEEKLRENGRIDEPVLEEISRVAETGTENNVLGFLGVIAYAVAAVCVTGCILLMSQRMIRKVRYRRMDVTGQFRAVVTVNLRILAMLGFRRDEKETLQEFRERSVCEGACDDCQLQFIADYEEILYGERGAEPEMLQTVMVEREELMKTLKEKKKWRYFLFCHCVVV